MAQVIKTTAQKSRLRPRVLIVDDEPDLIELIRDVVERAGNCRLLTASDLRQAEKIIASEKIDLLLADLHLPDGDGMSLLPRLRERNPSAGSVIITGNPSVNGAINAMRGGALDFLPKPFSADQLLDRVNKALERQAIVAKKEIRLSRLRVAVKKLNVTRHTISKKVDLLCNDLVSAYGELSRQLDTVRMQEGFRKLMNEANDLEQVLCHAMDWILRHCGYSNVAIWLASEGEEGYELGAYMKYTIAGDLPLTNAMRNGLVPLINREGSVHLFGSETRDHLTAAEANLLGGQEILGCNCTYLGEGLATLVMFRDEKCPFTDEDVAMVRAISPIFAVSLANIVRESQGGGEEEDGPLLDEDDHDNKKKPRKTDSDWWKRGEPPPF
jgi:response regulator of citrate/malate metabolism